MDERTNSNGHGSWFTGLLGRLESVWTDLVADAYVESPLQLMESNISNLYDFVEEVMSSSLFSSAFEQPGYGTDPASGASDQTGNEDHQRDEEEQHSSPADASTEETSCASNSSGLEGDNSTFQENLGSSTGSSAGAFAGFSRIIDMPDAGITIDVCTVEDVGDNSEESSEGVEEPSGFFFSVTEPSGFFYSKEMLSSSGFSTESCAVSAPDVEAPGNDVPEMETRNRSDETSDGPDALRHDIKLELRFDLGSSGKCCDQNAVDGPTGPDASATQCPIETTKPSDETKLDESFFMVKRYGDCSVRNGKPRRIFFKKNIGATIPSRVFPMKNGSGDEQNPAGAKSDEPTAIDRNMQSLPLHSGAEDWELSDSEWEII